jgi:hypothetical protein
MRMSADSGLVLPAIAPRAPADVSADDGGLGRIGVVIRVRPLSPPERHALGRMRQELAEAEGADVNSARALIDSLLEHGVKLEQERY